MPGSCSGLSIGISQEKRRRLPIAISEGGVFNNAAMTLLCTHMCVACRREGYFCGGCGPANCAPVPGNFSLQTNCAENILRLPADCSYPSGRTGRGPQHLLQDGPSPSSRDSVKRGVKEGDASFSKLLAASRAGNPPKVREGGARRFSSQPNNQLLCRHNQEVWLRQLIAKGGFNGSAQREQNYVPKKTLAVRAKKAGMAAAYAL